MAWLPASEQEHADTQGQAFHWLRTVAIGLSVLFVILAFETSWIIYSERKAVDFLSFWAAGHLVVVGRTALVYNIVSHRILEMMVAPLKGLLPFPYPPPFLLVVVPFGMMPYWLGFAAWIGLTYACFASSAAAIGKRYALPFALSHPSVIANFLIGQNGFLTGSIFLFGSKMLDRAPLLGGAILGLLVIKPQLAVLLPVAFIAGRDWKAFLGAATSSLSALLLAALVFGLGPYQGFFEILPVYARGIASSLWPWNELASPFAFFRYLGMPQIPALLAHGAIAIIGVFLTCRAWWLRSDNRVAILAAATMLVTPYLLTYDCLFLVVPIITLATAGRAPVLVALIWLCCFLPVADYFGWYHGPNTIPFASMLSLWGLHTTMASAQRTLSPATIIPAKTSTR